MRICIVTSIEHSLQLMQDKVVPLRIESLHRFTPDLLHPRAPGPGSAGADKYRFGPSVWHEFEEFVRAGCSVMLLSKDRLSVRRIGLKVWFVFIHV